MEQSPPVPTDVALAQVAAAHSPAPPPPAPPPPPPRVEPTHDEPLRLELRDADHRDAPWELDVQESGVTPSTDWDFDDDASSFAGPV